MAAPVSVRGNGNIGKIPALGKDDEPLLQIRYGPHRLRPFLARMNRQKALPEFMERGPVRSASAGWKRLWTDERRPDAPHVNWF